jgi:hypothetical protein
MEIFLFVIFGILFVIRIIGLYKNNDLRKPATWAYNLCIFFAGLAIGFAVENVSTGALLGVLVTIVINSYISTARWSLKLGGKLDKWNTNRNNKRPKPKDESN